MRNTRLAVAVEAVLVSAALLLGTVLPGCNRGAPETVPENLHLALDVGAVGPSFVRANVQIYSDGHGTYERYRTDEIMPEERVIDSVSFKLDADQMKAIWVEIQRQDFFQLKRAYVNEEIMDGYSAFISVVAHRDTHSVQARNVPIDAVNDIAAVVDEATPEAANLHHSPGLTWSERWDRLIENFR